MKKLTFLDLVALVVWLVPAAYALYIYDSLPQIVPVHFGMNGTVDRYGDKSELWLTVGTLLGVVALVYLLLRFISNIDPKKQVRLGQGTFRKLAAGIVIFISALNICTIYAAAHRGFQIEKLIMPLVGLMFIFIGNIMNSIKPNYFAGFRTPWTLESEDNWRATHRLVSRIWFAGGIVVTIGALLLPPSPATILLFCMIVMMTIVPLIYSYRYFKNHQVKQG